MDLLRPKTHPRPPKKGPSSSSKLQVNQARSSSRARKKTLAPSPSRRASDNSSVSGLSTLGTLKLGSEGSSAFGSREPSKVKGTLLSQTWPMGQQYLSPEVPVVEEEQNRAKDFTEQALAVKLCLPLEVAKQAAECFKHHAQCDARLKRSDFEKVLCEIFCISSVQELPDHFVSKVFHCADELLLGKSTKSIRDVARRMGINLLDIDRYKKVFDSYDKNKSGIKSYWNMADRDNNGVIDFPEFCQFYLKIFRKNGEENFQLGDIYRGIRNVPVRRRVSALESSGWKGEHSPSLNRERKAAMKFKKKLTLRQALLCPKPGCLFLKKHLPKTKTRGPRAPLVPRSWWSELPTWIALHAERGPVRKCWEGHRLVQATQDAWAPQVHKDGLESE
eukprot:g16784.t1